MTPQPQEDRAGSSVSRSRGTDRAATMAHSVGFQPQDMAVDELRSMKSPKDSASLSVTSSSAVEMAKGVGLLCGFEQEEEKIDTFGQTSSQLKSAKRKETSGMLKETAVKEVKSIGISSVSTESTVPIQNVHCEERLTTSKVRSKSTERAKLQGQEVGFVAEEEIPEYFNDKFEVKTNNALENRAKSLLSEQAQRNPRNEGLAPNKEETEELKHTTAKSEHIEGKLLKPKATETAFKQSKQFGLSDREDETSSLVLERPKEEVTSFEDVKIRHTERAHFKEKSQGFEADKEIAEAFDKKCQVQTELAKEGKAKSLVTNAAQNIPRKEGVNLELEASESLVKVEMKREAAKKSAIRSESSERASSLARQVGYNPEEQEVVGLVDSKKSQTQAKTTRTRSESSERASIQSRALGVVAEMEKADNFTKTFKKKGETANERNEVLETTRVTQEGAQLGFLPEEQITEDLTEEPFETETLIPQDVKKPRVDQAFRTSRHVGISTQIESSGKVDDLKLNPQEAKVVRSSQQKEQAHYQALSTGVDITEDDTQEFSVERAQGEKPELKTETPLTRSKATRMSKKQGFHPVEQSSQNISLHESPATTAISGKARSESNDRAFATAQRMGFEPLDLSTESMKDHKPIYGTAIQESQKKTKAKAQKMSISGGRLDKRMETEELTLLTDKKDQVKEKIERKQSCERAIILSQTMGFTMDTEDTSNLENAGKKVDDEKGVMKIESAKGRATSKPRVQGYEPLVEDVKEVSSEGLRSGMAQKCEDKIHRESRSRAVKRDQATGVGQPVELTQAIQSTILPQEEVMQTVAGNQLVVADSTTVQSEFLPQVKKITDKEAAQSSSEEVDVDATTDLKRPSEESATAAENRKKIVKVKIAKSEEQSNIEERNEEDHGAKFKVDMQDLTDDTHKDKEKLSKVSAKKPAKPKPEIKPEADGTFAVKLKKSGVVKRQIEDAKLETVKLKHHEFENEPQMPADEGTTSVTMKTALEDFDKKDTKKKVKKTIKNNKKTKVDEPSQVDSDSESVAPEEKPKNIRPIKKTEQPVKVAVEEDILPETDSDIDDFEIIDDFEMVDAAEIEALNINESEEPAQEKTKVTKKVVQSAGKKSSQQVDEDEEAFFDDEPDQKEVANVAKAEEPLESATYNDIQTRRASTVKVADKNKSPKTSIVEPTPEIKTEEDGTFAIKLKKAEVVKRQIPKIELETVDLAHHEFENVPQEPEDELKSNIKLGTALPEFEEVKEGPKKKKIIKKKSPDQTTFIQAEKESENNSPDKEDEKLPMKAHKEKSPEASTSEKKVEPKIEKPLTKQLKKVPEKPVKKASKKVAEEEGTFVKPKLKKAETVKREILDVKLETVNLKSHAFEKQPQAIPEEMKTKLTLGKPLPDLKDDIKDKKEPKVLKKKKKKQPEVKDNEPSIEEPKDEVDTVMTDTPKPIAQMPRPALKANNVKEEDLESPLEDIGTEFALEEPVQPEKATISKERDQNKAKKAKTQVGFKPKIEEEESSVEKVERKERDPIAIPAAAVVKKHSDVDKIELPTFLNYPSEQGEIVDLDETKEKSPKIMAVEPFATIEDEGTEFSTASAKETTVIKKVSQKKKEPTDTKYRDIPIIKTDMAQKVSVCDPHEKQTNHVGLF